MSLKNSTIPPPPVMIKWNYRPQIRKRALRSDYTGGPEATFQRYRSSSKYRETENLRRSRYKEFINRIKARPCVDCGIQYNPWVMQFDHRNPLHKKYEIHRMVCLSMRTIQAEIEKCDVVCANCHAERTQRGVHWKIRRNAIVQSVRENPQGELPLAD